MLEEVIFIRGALSIISYKMIKIVTVSLSLVAVGAVGLRAPLCLEQLKAGAHSSPFAALTSSDSTRVLFIARLIWRVFQAQVDSSCDSNS